jgi:hypothetical protein
VAVPQFNDYESEAKRLIEVGLPLPGYEMVMKASHSFNLLDARGAISVTERAAYIGRVRALARLVAQAYTRIARGARFSRCCLRTLLGEGVSACMKRSATLLNRTAHRGTAAGNRCTPHCWASPSAADCRRRWPVWAKALPMPPIQGARRSPAGRAGCAWMLCQSRLA